MVNDNILRVVGYARISSDSQIENTSIEEQKERIYHHCKGQGWDLDHIFVDEGFSGSNTDRPAYKNMMRYLEENEGKIHAIVVWKMDRAHRNQLNLLKFIKEDLAGMGMDFVSITESFDTSTPIGRMMLGILSTFGEFERETINERTRGGRLATAKKNKYAGGQVPYGYKVSDGEVRLIKEQAEIVKRIFQEFVDGSSYYKIAKLLNKEGVPPKIQVSKKGVQKKQQWYPMTVRRIVTTETYTGFNKYSGERERNEIKQKGVYPKIISRQLWNKAQSRLKGDG